MSLDGRFAPSLHDPEAAVPASPAWLRRRLERRERLAVVPFNQAMEPTVRDGRPLEVVRRTDGPVRPGDVVVAEIDGAARVVRCTEASGPQLRVKPDALRDRTSIREDDVLAIVPTSRSSPWRLTGRFLPAVHAAWRALDHHARHFQQTPETATASVQRRYSDPACVASYARKDQRLSSLEEGLVERWLPNPGRALVGGCAAGRLPIALTDLGWKVVGVDVVPEMIAAAREASGDRAIDYHCADLESLGEDLGRFDLVFLGNFVHGNVPGCERRLRMLRRLAGLLEPRGTLVLSVRRYRGLGHYLRLNLPLPFLGGELTEWGDFSGHDLAGDLRPTYFYYHFFTERELARELRRGGFDVLQQHRIFAVARRRG